LSREVSEIVGSIFKNGAQTGAFSYLFNDAAWRFSQLLRSGVNAISRALTVVGGGGQVLLGGALCSTVAGCVFGAPIATLGASNIQEGITGQNGFARDGFQALFGEKTGDLAFGAVNLGTSVTGLGRVAILSRYEINKRLYVSRKGDTIPDSGEEPLKMPTP